MKEIIASDYIRAKHVLIAKTTENAAEIAEEVRRRPLPARILTS